MAGYSTRSLKDKLGLRDRDTAIFINETADYQKNLGDISHIIIKKDLKGTFNFIHYFITEKLKLESTFPQLTDHLQQNGMLWISWPKKSSKISTDLDENIIREIGLKNGLVDVKVCAIDEDWSGLKFVIRVKDRKMVK